MHSVRRSQHSSASPAIFRIVLLIGAAAGRIAENSPTSLTVDGQRECPIFTEGAAECEPACGGSRLSGVVYQPELSAWSLVLVGRSPAASQSSTRQAVLRLGPRECVCPLRIRATTSFRLGLTPAVVAPQFRSSRPSATSVTVQARPTALVVQCERLPGGVDTGGWYRRNGGARTWTNLFDTRGPMAGRGSGRGSSIKSAPRLHSTRIAIGVSSPTPRARPTSAAAMLRVFGRAGPRAPRRCRFGGIEVGGGHGNFYRGHEPTDGSRCPSRVCRRVPIGHATTTAPCCCNSRLVPEPRQLALFTGGRLSILRISLARVRSSTASIVITGHRRRSQHPSMVLPVAA
jgi:hypothetical protein